MDFTITGKLGLDGKTFLVREVAQKESEVRAKAGRKRTRKESKARAFLQTHGWKEVRKQAIGLYGSKCHKCGSEERIQVDHIKPKSKYPEIALAIDNLQILCWPCNKKKSYRDETDYRPASAGFLLGA